MNFFRKLLSTSASSSPQKLTGSNSDMSSQSVTYCVESGSIASELPSPSPSPKAATPVLSPTEEARWVDRNEVITRIDHENYVDIAKQILEEIVEEASQRESPGKQHPDIDTASIVSGLTTVSDDSFVTLDSTNPSASLPDLLKTTSKQQHIYSGTDTDVDTTDYDSAEADTPSEEASPIGLGELVDSGIAGGEESNANESDSFVGLNSGDTTVVFAEREAESGSGVSFCEGLSVSDHGISAVELQDSTLVPVSEDPSLIPGELDRKLVTLVDSDSHVSVGEVANDTEPRSLLDTTNIELPVPGNEQPFCLNPCVSDKSSEQDISEQQSTPFKNDSLCKFLEDEPILPKRGGYNLDFLDDPDFNPFAAGGGVPGNTPKASALNFKEWTPKGHSRKKECKQLKKASDFLDSLDSVSSENCVKVNFTPEKSSVCVADCSPDINNQQTKGLLKQPDTNPESQQSNTPEPELNLEAKQSNTLEPEPNSEAEQSNTSECTSNSETKHSNTLGFEPKEDTELLEKNTKGIRLSEGAESLTSEEPVKDLREKSPLNQSSVCSTTESEQGICKITEPESTISTATIPDSELDDIFAREAIRVMEAVTLSQADMGDTEGNPVDTCVDEKINPFASKKKLAHSPTRSSLKMNEAFDIAAQENHSEAGPEIAEGFAEEFKPPDAAFLESLDSFNQMGKGNIDTSRLARDSLFVKFDPLAPKSEAARTAAFQSALINTIPERDQPKITNKDEKMPNRKVNLDETSSLIVFGSPNEKKVRDDAPVASEKSKLSESPVKAPSQEIVRQQLLHQEQLLKKDKEICQLQQALAEHEKSEKKMSIVVAEYEQTISALIEEKEKQKAHATQKEAALIRDRNQAMEDLRNVEMAFTNLHRKYERTKETLDSCLKNEELLKGYLSDYESRIKKQDDKYDRLKTHAEEEFEKARQEVETMQKNTDGEIARLKILLRKSELKNATLEETIKQQANENNELTAICDDLLSKVAH